MEILTCTQGDDAWFAARIGSIGGSSIADVVAGGQGKMRKNLMYRLAGEILSGEKYIDYTNAHMARGIEQESAAREMYSFITDNQVEQVGLIKETAQTHHSPDGMVNPDGIIEIKCVIPSVHIETIISDSVPPGYVKQIQWGLHICQRQWCDFISYSPTIQDRPIWIKRMGRNEALIKDMADGADKFLIEMAMIIRKIKAME